MSLKLNSFETRFSFFIKFLMFDNAFLLKLKLISLVVLIFIKASTFPLFTLVEIFFFTYSSTLCSASLDLKLISRKRWLTLFSSTIISSLLFLKIARPKPVMLLIIFLLYLRIVICSSYIVEN